MRNLKIFSHRIAAYNHFDILLFEGKPLRSVGVFVFNLI